MGIIKLLGRKKLYFTIIFSFITLCILIVVSMSYIFTNIYMDAVFDQTTAEYQNGLERANNSIDNLYKSIDQIYIYMMMNMDIFIYLNQTESDSQTDNNARIQVRTMKLLNPYIYSIDLYNGVTGTNITIGNTKFDLGNYTGGSSVQLPKLSNKRNIILTKPAETVVSNSNNNNSDNYYISLVYTEHSSGDGSLSNLVSVNLDEKTIYNDIISKFDGVTFIAGKDGTIISHPDKSIIMKNIANDQYFKKIIGSQSNTGSFRFDNGLDDNIITYFGDSDSNFFIINVKPYSSIIKEIQQKRNIIVLISFIILLVFSSAAFILSKKIYSPIGTITNKFKSSKYNTEGAGSNEVSLIMNVFKETENQMIRLKAENEKNISKVKKDLLRQLLSNNASEDISVEALKECQICIDIDNLFIVAVMIDGYNQLSADKKFVYEKAIETSIPEILKDDFKCETVSMYRGEIAVLLNYTNREENDFNTLISRFDSLKQLLKKMFEVSITVGIGSVSNKICECNTAYKTARDMVKHRFIFGHDKIIYPQYVDENLVSSLNYPKEIEDKLVEAIKIQSRDEYAKNLEQIIFMIRNYTYSDSILIFMQVALRAINAFCQFTSENNSKLHIYLEELNNLFLDLETLDQAKLWMMRLFDEYLKNIEAINQMKGKDYYRIVDEMKQYIKMNYNDINLCVEQLAEKVGYSPNYFAKVFKDTVGIYINDYIRQVRINKAKELLKESRCKISEVSQMVGFINNSHFYSAFKKEVGLTPAAFRSFILESPEN